MSDTPKTDAAEINGLFYSYVRPSFARNLELENTELAKQFVSLVNAISEMRLKVDKADARAHWAEVLLKHWKEDEGQDAKRFEWLLERQVKRDFYHGGCQYSIGREELDKRMKAEAEDHE